MPLEVRQESVFCLDFTRKKKGEFIPYEATIPEVVYRKCFSDRIAVIFDSEKLALTFGQLKSEMEQLAAGLLSSGLQQADRILICGHNHSHVLLAALGAARAGLVFSLASPNFNHSDQLKHLLELGQFRAVVLFSPNGGSDWANNLVLECCPELQASPRGHTKCKALPKLTHVILADEDHKHAGTFTLSEIFGKSTKERIEKLPNYAQWNCHKLAAIQFTLGSTAAPKAVGLTHYQLINGCRIAANAICIRRETILSCALPMFRIPVFCLVALTPFLTESCSVFSEPSPLPRLLFNSINKYQCTNLLSNAAALRLLLSMARTQKILLPSVKTVILLGERVSTELLTSIDKVMKNAKRIAVGMLSTEVGAVPILSDNTTNLAKAVGKPLEGYQMDVVKIDKLGSSKDHTVGELRLKPLAKTKFVGYGPKFSDFAEWISTGDVVSIHKDGNVEIVTHKDDLIYDKNDKLVEHWRMERLMAQEDSIRGVQVVQVCHGAPIIAVIVPKSLKSLPEFFKTDLSNLCKNDKLHAPDQFAIVADFPRVNTKIQKFKLRELILYFLPAEQQMEHIELVKGYLQKGLVKPGLDYNLLKEVRREIEENGNAEDCDEDLLENEEDEIEQLPSNQMVRKTCEILFPSAIQQEKHRERRNELFGEKRMAYVVDFADESGGDIPSTLIRSRAGCPVINQAKAKAEEDLHRKCVQIMAAMRYENGDGKKRQQTSTVDLVSNSHLPASANQKVFEDVDDYSPSDLKPLQSEKPSHREEGSYFESTRKMVDGGVYCGRDLKPRGVGTGSSIGERNRMAENETEEAKRHMIEDNRFKRRRLERDDDAYAELYPVNIGFLQAAGESDEEADFSKMNLGGSKAIVKRCNIDNDLEKYQESREAVPKAAFQRGVKANGGRKTCKNSAAGEKKRLNKEMDKISKILDERKNKSGS